MSSLTVDEVAELARVRLGWPPNESPRLLILVPPALKSLAMKIARREDFKALRAEVSVTCTSGVITLSDASILAQVLVETGELLINGAVAKPVPRYRDLFLAMPNDVYRWALRTPTKIYVKNITTGALGAVSQSGTLTFNYLPSLSQLPETYEKELVDEVVLLATAKVEKSPAQSFSKGDEPVSVNLNAS